MNDVNVLSLFDGISCGRVALERAGIPVGKYYASEIEKNAIAISEKNYPDIIRLGDVTRWREWDIPWESIDLIIAGSPCQGFSRNGKMLNFDDPRSRLFFEFVDILAHVRSKNPAVKFMLENVKMKTEWSNVISEHLGVAPLEINSGLVSGQNRGRLYWTNVPDVVMPADKHIRLMDVLDVPEAADYVSCNGVRFGPDISAAARNLVSVVNGEIRVAQATKRGYIVAENGDGINLSFPTSKSRRGRVISGKSATLDCACNICVLQDGVIRYFTTKELERLQTLPEGYTDGATKTAARAAIGNGWTVDVIAHILSHLRAEVVSDGC